MSNLTSNLPHMVITLAVIGAVAALAAIGVIPGTDAIAIIAAVGGSLGGGRRGVVGRLIAGAVDHDGERTRSIRVNIEWRDDPADKPHRE